MGAQTNLIGQAVQGAWKYDIQMNLSGQAVQGAWRHVNVKFN